jgi:hypothetical protein
MKYIYITIILFTVFSCNHKSSLENDVRLSIQQFIKQEYPDFEILNFKLKKITNNYYEGILHVSEENKLGVTYYVDVQLHEDNSFDWEIRDDEVDQTNYKNESSFSDNQNEYNINQEKVSLKDHLTRNTFSINNNGTVIFRFNSYSNIGSISINGGGATLAGQCEVINDILYVKDLGAVSGNFDASNNRGSSGMLYLSKDGSLSGSLHDGNGNSRNIQLIIR